MAGVNGAELSIHRGLENPELQSCGPGFASVYSPVLTSVHSPVHCIAADRETVRMLMVMV